MALTAPLPSEVDGHRLGTRLAECGDDTLARLVADADEAAFAVLYERHYQALYRYCRQIVRDDLDAQDALQSAWTGALVALRHGRRNAPVRPWLYRIVHNEAISLLRRRRRGPEPDDAPRLRAPSAEDHAIDRERFAMLVADLRQLPERPRGALLMRELNGLSHEEIAVALDTSVAAAKQCVYEARRHLAEFAAGRQTPCDEICRSISDGDGRVRRGRRVMAHLRDCPGCAAFASTIDERRGALQALTPCLAAPAAIAALDRVLRSGWGTGGAAAGTAAGSSAGAVATKALGMSVLTKAVVAAAAVTAGVASVGGIGKIWHGTAHPAAVRSAPSGPGHRTAGSLPPVVAPVRPGRSFPPPGARATGRGGAAKRGAAASATTAGRGRRTAGAGHTAGRIGPGQARNSAAAPGQSQQAPGSVPPGQSKKAGGSAAPGQSRHAAAPGQARRAAGVVAPGPSHKAAKVASPGQSKKPAKVASPGQSTKTATSPGQSRKSAVTAPGQSKKAVVSATAHQAAHPVSAAAAQPGAGASSSATAPASAATPKATHGDVHAK